MKNWTIADGESPRVYLINDGHDAVGEIVYTDTRRPEDARLIAAAPDLLDALRWVSRCASMAGPAGTTAYIISDEIMNKARAAIAKAEGEGS